MSRSEIISPIIGPRPSLFIPAGYKRETGRLGPQVGVFYKYSDIFNDADCSRRFCETISQLPFEYALLSLVAINNALLKSHFDKEVHRFLETTCICPEHIAKFQSFAHEHSAPDIRVVFHRANCLANIKALLNVPERIGCIDPQLIGDLALALNEFMTGHQFRAQPSKPDDLDLVIEFASSWDIYNPVEVAHGISRVAIMMDYLCGSDPVVVQKRKELGIDPATLRFDDLPLAVYQAVVFGLFAHVSSRSPQTILGNPGVCAFDRQEFLRNVKLPQEYLDAFLRRRSLTTEEFRQKVRDRENRDLRALLEDPNVTNDFTLFRQHPILNFTPEKYLILDHHFLGELLVQGLFWQIFDGLPADKREEFSNLWGRLGERYARSLMSYVYGISSISPMRPNVVYKGGEVDLLLDFGTIAILFECKASLLTRAAKYSRDRTLFEKEIHDKFVQNARGKPKALRQLANAAAAAVSGELPIGTNAQIYPVLITYEPTLESFGINEYLDALFQKELCSRESRIWPLTVMSIDELEEVLPYFEQNAWSWPSFFADRFGDHRRVPGYSVHQSLYNYLKNTGIARISNQFLMATFEKVYSSIVREYGGAEGE